MKTNKIVRSICYFTNNPSVAAITKTNGIAQRLAKSNYLVQTKRICSGNLEKITKLDGKFASENYLFGIGSLSKEDIKRYFLKLLSAKDISFNLDLTHKEITLEDAEILFEIIKAKPGKTFNFAYVFNNPPSSPYFPSASYQHIGFSIGFQPTDLSQNCHCLEEWLQEMKKMWLETYSLFEKDPEFLGLDSSTAPLFTDKGSLIAFINKLGYGFSSSTTTDLYLRITKFIKEENPMPVGLCGLMLPCLEDFELAKEYEKKEFTIERNIFLSLQCGLGIDTYPIGVDEKPERVREILKMIQRLSDKYQKPLSARFVSDGKAKIGEKTDFQNQYLKDVVIIRI